MAPPPDRDVLRRRRQPVCIVRAAEVLRPDRGKARQQREDEKRRELLKVGFPQVAVRPPEQQTEDERQDDRRGLAGHCQRREEKRQRIPKSALSGPLPFQEEENRKQEEETRLGVLYLGDPRDRLDLHRVQRPQRGAKPRSRHLQRAQDLPKRDRARRVKGDVEHMIRHRRQSPKLVSEPQRRQRERTDIRRARGPDFLQTERPHDRAVLGQHQIVVPDVARAPDRLVDEKNSGDQAQRANALENPRARWSRRRAILNLVGHEKG